MKTTILILLFLSLLNLQALTQKEYLGLKTALYEALKDHNSVHQDESLEEIQQAYYKARYKLLEKAAESDQTLAKLYEQLKEINSTSSKEGLYKNLRGIEFHLITVSKEKDQLTELYSAWNKALSDLESKKISLVNAESSISGARVRKAIRALQKARK